MSSQLTSESPRRRLNARQRSTVERLLAAGQEELREVGHEALTIRTVAVRAGVSPATAYTYLASKHHLFAELFLRHIAQDHDAPVEGATVTERVQNVSQGVVSLLVAEPELTAAVTPALLGSDEDVVRLRLRIGSEFVSRFEAALRDPAQPAEPVDPAVLEVLILTFFGALLQVGMDTMSYDQMAERLESAFAVILRGNV
ncbi:AcrR family transcriptional regulator [Aeromicrobium panaciterrae]|uniref:AcrR family transcriptional regulator n=1 Tax=Aeromicrobium panaciterrae TaxID=363861 RepID=A0ABU1UMB5_9ACTN|nr:TetR/AcrR family transcriptional regulator [Aeromicrobium panaciterrae]MDR7086328.1 AcrR family transcriptional regulator [Aeromicrobium panaciterrae]